MIENSFGTYFEMARAGVLCKAADYLENEDEKLRGFGYNRHSVLLARYGSGRRFMLEVC